MKTRILITFFLLISFCVFAQQKNLKYVSLIATYGFSDFHFDNNANHFNPIGSYNFGIITETNNKKSLSLSCFVTKKGSKIEYNNFLFNITYLTIAIQFNYNLTEKLDFKFGPYMSALIYKKITGDDQHITSTIDDQFKGNDFGIQLVQSLMLTNRIAIVSNQQLGLRNLQTESYGFRPNKGDRINNVTVNIGLLYKL
ncbi:MAG: hypothetical protein RI952_1485 [Bacteroidota bacterium]|jgi:hypothetical protein